MEDGMYIVKTRAMVINGKVKILIRVGERVSIITAGVTRFVSGGSTVSIGRARLTVMEDPVDERTTIRLIVPPDSPAYMYSDKLSLTRSA
jgi:hypothetical protein